MNDYPCCECCLTDPLHPDHHEVSCPTCNNPTADRLRAELTQMREERDNALAKVESLILRLEESAETNNEVGGKQVAYIACGIVVVSWLVWYFWGYIDNGRRR